MTTGDITIMVAAFAVVASLILIVSVLLGGSESSTDGPAVTTTAARFNQRTDRPLPQMGSILMPKSESRTSRLKARMLQAGLYKRHSTAIYLGVKFAMMVTPMFVGFMLSTVGFVTLRQGLAFGAIVGLVGTVAPSFWLDYEKSKRQKTIRRAMPDALDVIVVCLEGGLSLPAALARVGSELRQAHPLLAEEMSIVRREIQLGRTTGEALRDFANRFDASELRSLASVVSQAERFGASVVKAMRVHAETLRLKRYQWAEAQAQKAPLKLIFPTVLLIFPALYIVLMGPAGVKIMQMLKNM
ncbi:MAG: type II secretion system F family protein [Planctomycetota bacterium]|nr:type II secretion system F family protein [Planctomycetota bacterium]